MQVILWPCLIATPNMLPLRAHAPHLCQFVYRGCKPTPHHCSQPILWPCQRHTASARPSPLPPSAPIGYKTLHAYPTPSLMLTAHPLALPTPHSERTPLTLAPICANRFLYPARLPHTIAHAHSPSFGPANATQRAHAPHLCPHLRQRVGQVH